ncbi:keto-deoxy-phosphogluconate aldolase [Boudabousia liubingyangii]|uniref:Keto-deoxy-phosphogluconate aldolase n=1 Tax=Boudabousia liubingyangii TaxID=1921764 RepID=A0A1Q5PN41_9ACTO|nr:bifunctional 4-hydroxy-2-oxoglutarate aldolase/2-dehydro-3-deoxy-phosphogluconate aldolase [Boudabousia liubingyangii]OKL47438.1 keto-deoxy-phosphogluconate aldolase [Boudabousia liubingyangii]OKL48860.1 keto-deoxy-phosphogluconate aldolase [Boudabousia liubingyangii]
MPSSNKGAKVSAAEIQSRKIVPVVVVDDAATASELGDAMVRGNLPVAEVTFRTAAAPKAMEIMSSNPELIVGAGTVITAEQVDQAIDCGAQFIVSPGTNIEVIERALELDVPVFPGAVTPSEIMTVLSLGLKTVKFFPASTFGGAAAIKSLSAPFVGVNFMPTGGVSLNNMADYLSLSCIPAVGGSWMVPAAAVNAGEFEKIERLCSEAVAAAAAL